MNAIRIRKQIGSETLHLPELKPLIGRSVEIIILDEISPEFECLETEETFFGAAPPEPTPEEHEANMAKLREKAKADPRAAAWLRLIEADAIDVEAVIQARGMQ